MKNYFKLEELLRSDKALKNKIENLPSWEVISHLQELLPLLNDIRDKWGSAINISSGYRSEKLNKLVGGAAYSAHKRGYAADFQPSNGEFDKFVVFLKDWAKDKDFDQLIIESNKTSRWIHIGLFNRLGEQRKMLFNIDK